MGVVGEGDKSVMSPVVCQQLLHTFTSMSLQGNVHKMHTSPKKYKHSESLQAHPQLRLTPSNDSLVEKGSIWRMKLPTRA